MLLLVALASAHPFSGKAGAGEPGSVMVGQRLKVTIEADTLTVAYTAEVPAIRVYREAKAEGADATYAAKKVEELRGALRASWDGAPLPLTPVTVLDPARAGDQGFLEFHVTATAPIPHNGRLQVHNGNFPDEDCYFLSEVTLGPDVLVEAASLLTVRSGMVRDNTHGAWVKTESARELSLTIRPAAIWEDAGGEGRLPTRMAELVPMRRWIFGLPVLVLLPIVMVVARRRLR